MQRREEGLVNGYVGDVVSDVLLTSIVAPKLVDYVTARNRLLHIVVLKLVD